VPSRGPPVRHSLQISTKPATTRPTTANRAGCVRRGMRYKMCFSGRSSRKAAEDHTRPNILQLNIEWLTANKISVIEQLAYRNKAFIIVLQETHCATAHKPVIPNFSPAGSVLSRNHGLATFVHELSEWLLVDQSPEQSETGWLCISVLESTNFHAGDLHHRPFRHSHTPVCMLATSTASMSTEVTTQHLLTVRAWSPGQHPTTLEFCITQRKQPASSLTNGTSAPTGTWPSRVSARKADCGNRRVLREFSRAQYQPSLIKPRRLKVPAPRDPVKRWNFHKADWKRVAFSQMNPLRDCHLRTHQTSRGYTRIFARTSYPRPSNACHVAVGRTMCHAGRRVQDLISLLQPGPSGD